MKIFDHTSSEPGMWRAWLKNGQSLELTWGWCRSSVGLRVGQHGRSRHLWIGLGVAQVFVPIGIDPKGEDFMGDEPDFGLDVSREFGIWWRWGRKSKRWEWPFRRETLAWEYEGADGQWHSKLGPFVPFDERPPAKTETHKYTYVLRSGKEQHRTATIRRERWVIGRRYLHRLGWPKDRHMDIAIDFSDEVGERSGSWKGGCVGCSYRMTPGETPLETLRRMEHERDF